MDESEFLDKWNSQLTQHLIGNNVILVIYIIIGILGNLLVIFIYSYKLSKKKDDRYFIPVLATMDLLACTTGASYALALNLLPAKFSNDIVCKLFWYLSEATTIVSALLLIVIAVQRYLKVCKPLITFSLLWKRIAILLCLGTAFLFSIPTLFFYGELKFRHPINTTIIGSRCGQLERSDSIFRTAVISYTVLEFIIAIVGCISFTILYALIGKQIYKKFIIFKRTMTLRRRPIRKVKKKSDSSTTGSKNRESVDSIDIDIGVSSVTDSKESIVDGENPPKRKKRRSLDILQDNVSALKAHFHIHRYSYMFMTITAVFAVAFAPRITLMVLESVNPNFWKNLVGTPSTIAVCLFFYRFYIFNHIINPFIYGFFDTTFTHEVKKVFCNKKDLRGSDTEY